MSYADGAVAADHESRRALESIATPRPEGSRTLWISLCVLISICLAAAFAPLIAPYPVGAEAGPPFDAPSLDHLLGTDDVGHDLLSELIYGARVSLSIGLIVGTFSVLSGAAVGILAGFFRGPVDAVAMRTVDIILSLPFLPLLIVLAAFLGAGFAPLLLILTLLLWARPARSIRSLVLSLRERADLEAARALGASPWRLLHRYVAPHVLPLALAEFVRLVAAAILIESTLSFLGLGDPAQKGWGTILYYASARGAFLTDAWAWWVLPPGLLITATVLPLALIGMAAEARADPRIRHAAASHGRMPHKDPEPTAGDTGEPYRATSAPGSLLRVDKLRTIYVSQATYCEVVSGVDFSIERSETLGIVGESGCGKTSLALSLMRLIKPPGHIVSGEIRFEGRNLLALSNDQIRRLRGRHLALLAQSTTTSLDPLYTARRLVAEAVRTHTRLNRHDASEAAAALLAETGLPRERLDAYPHELSGGMRQRVALAVALAGVPSLLIADEPTSGLDVIAQRRICILLRTVKARRRLAMILISHDLNVIAGMADRLLVMYAGRIVEEGPPQALMQKPFHPYTQGLLAAANPGSAPEGQIHALEGRPPHPAELPRGCAFAPRCSAAHQRCLERRPPLRHHGRQRRVACFLYEE